MPRETGSTPKLLNEFEVHLYVHLLGLCHSLFPASTVQLVMFARGCRLETVAKCACSRTVSSDPFSPPEARQL